MRKRWKKKWRSRKESESTYMAWKRELERECAWVHRTICWSVEVEEDRMDRAREWGGRCLLRKKGVRWSAFRKQHGRPSTCGRACRWLEKTASTETPGCFFRFWVTFHTSSTSIGPPHTWFISQFLWWSNSASHDLFLFCSGSFRKKIKKSISMNEKFWEESRCYLKFVQAPDYLREQN